MSDRKEKESIKPTIMSEDLEAEHFGAMYRRNWSDQGMLESLDVLRQTLLSGI
jgi:hypothetical protein